MINTEVGAETTKITNIMVILAKSFPAAINQHNIKIIIYGFLV